jgi:hypothetical protein
MKLIIVMISALVILATPAAAETCEALLIKVEAAMKSSQATAEKKEQAQKLRDEGTVQRSTGGDCVPPLLEALQLLKK